MRTFRAIAIGLALSAAPCVGAAPDFERDLLPIFSRRCLGCHGEEMRMGNLDLRTPAAISKGGSKGPAIAAGSAEDSLLYQRIIDKSMPLGDEKVSATEAALIKQWIEAAPRTVKQDEAVADAEAPAQMPEASHWAFMTPRRPAVPDVLRHDRVRTPVDAFIQSKLEQSDIASAPPAERRTLLRRAYLVLTGLPPTPQQTAAFLADQAPDSYDRLIDDLLARPQFGERWARHWLDVVRYAESNGYERDGAKPHAWRYRDYVIEAFQKDKPFDRFLAEQLAGDEIENSDAESQIATTFLRLGTWDDEPADPMVDRYDQLDDVLGVSAATFLGVTIRCARCHDHKFEPFSQKDYYRLLAVFEPLKRPQDNQKDLDRLVGTEGEIAAYRTAMEKANQAVNRLRGEVNKTRQVVLARLFKKAADPSEGLSFLNHAETVLAYRKDSKQRTDREKELVAAFEKNLDAAVFREATEQEAADIKNGTSEIESIEASRPAEPPRAYIWYEDSSIPPVTRLLERGDTTQPTDVVYPAAPTVLGRTSLDPDVRPISSTGRRLALARWMTDARNPLVSRVIVNRIWQWYFGEGLVASENDFGVAGERPSHPELLDYLATELVQSGWSLKHLHRLIAKSATFQRSTEWNEAAAAKDAGNRLLWRWKPRRLEAEVVRDSMLAVSGGLNPKRGGASIFPALPQSVLDGQSRPGLGWETSDAAESSRRSIYVFIKRSLAVPELEMLDAPDNSSSCEHRRVSITGPQALTFLNGDFTNEQARLLAQRLRREAGSDNQAQIRLAFQLALSRPPSDEQIEEASRFLAKQAAQVTSDSAAPASELDVGLKSLEAFCLVLLNMNEFFYLS
ncbi:MAG TPA: PSD1 and planctomycete cytochrome C domain-containing protein [Bryobacterales bacterium]|nr:PSD1 and planctomycete cytochrome C domain-containing protein [Bryobacterales bacterium]